MSLYRFILYICTTSRRTEPRRSRVRHIIFIKKIKNEK